MQPSPNEYGNAAFVAAALDEVLAMNDGTFNISSILSWVPESVYDALFERKQYRTTSEKVIGQCRSLNLIDQAFEMTIAQLLKYWEKLLPDRKRNLITLIENHGIKDRFAKSMLFLSRRDEEALLIRWDVADLLFNREKHEVLGKLPKDWKGRPSLLALDKWGMVYEHLMVLLDKKVNYDLSVIHLAVGTHASRYTHSVVSRTEVEYFEYLRLCRDVLTDIFMDVYPERYGPRRLSPSGDVELNLEPFKKQFEDLKLRIVPPVRNHTILEEVAQFIRSHPLPTLTTEPKYVRKIDTGGGDYVERPTRYKKIVNNYALNASAQKLLATVEMPELAAELRGVLEGATKKAKVADEYKSLGIVAEAAHAAESGDQKTAGQKIAELSREAGKWIYDIAKELSASVLAKIIEAQFNLG